MRIRVIAIATLSLALTAAAHADDLITYQDGSSSFTISFEVPSSPVPDFVGANSFELFAIPVSGTYLDGTPFSGSSNIFFYDGTGGGLDVPGENIGLVIYSGQLFSGSNASPTFIPGTYALNAPSYILEQGLKEEIPPTGSLIITDLGSQVPEPSSLALLTTGTLGLISTIRRRLSNTKGRRVIHL